MAQGRRFLQEFDPLTIYAAFKASAEVEAKGAPIPKNRVKSLVKKFTREPEEPHWTSYHLEFMVSANEFWRLGVCL